MKYLDIIVILRNFIAAVVIVGVVLAEVTMAASPATTNFRVDNGIFKVPQTEPFVRTVTVFLDGVVYDFVFESERITIYDEIKEVFILINVKEGVRAVVPTKFVDKAIERLALHAAKEKGDSKTSFFYNPQFKPTQKDITTGELIFQSPWLTYRVAAKQGDVKATKQYQRFADAYARLNTVLRPGSNPPFARILVNRALAENTMLPQAVRVTYGEEGDSDALQFRSEHRYEMKLDENDKKRIEDVKKSLETLKAITLEEFQKL